MMNLWTEPLCWPVLLPGLAGLVCLLVPERLAAVRGAWAVAAAAATAFSTWGIFAHVRGLPSDGALVFTQGAWLRLRADHLSAFVLLAIAVFGVLIGLYSMGAVRQGKGTRAYFTYLLWTLAAAGGVVLADDLILLLVFWGVLGITLYLMIGLAGPEASSAAKKSLIIVGGSDCVLMLGVVLVGVLAGTTRISAISLPLSGELAHVAFLCFVVAAFAKAGAVPVHTWVPDFGEKAAASVSAFLPASLDKLLGIYLLARAATGLFAMADAGAMNALLMALGALTVILAVMMALVQHDFKRLLAYHAVSQVGYMVLGIGSGTLVGIAGGLFHMLNHAIYKSCLFLCAGAVEQKTGSTDLDRLGGLARAMPLTFGAFVVAALAISGIPPLNGFTSKWMVYRGIIESGRDGGRLWALWLAAAMLGSALTLASFVKVMHAAFLRKPAGRSGEGARAEVGFAMAAPMVVLAALCVLFGIFPVRLALGAFIFPAVGQVDMTGWLAGPATGLLGAAFAAGLALYAVFAARHTRECETYIGGERMGDAYLTGAPVDARRDVEVTGVDFYGTIQELRLLRPIYHWAARKVFDIYDVGTRVLFYFVEVLRSLHAGRLPLYLTWLVAGLLILLWVLSAGVKPL